MKKLLLFLFLVFSLSVFGQNNNPAIISGQIINPTSSSILIGDSVVSLSPKGEFSYPIHISRRKYFEVKYDIHFLTLFITPEEKLNISFDAKKFNKSIKFSGNSSTINYLLLDQKLTDQEVNNFFNTNWTQIFSKDEPAFIKTIDSLKQLYFRTLYALEARKQPLDKGFVFDLKNEINFGFDRLILYYPQQHFIFTGQNVNFSQTTKAHLDSVNLDNPQLIEIKNYLELGKEWIDWKIREEFSKNEVLKKTDNQWLKSAFEIITRSYKDEKVREFWLFNYLIAHITNQGVKNIEEYIKTFNSISKSDPLKEKINGLYQKEMDQNNGHLILPYKKVDGFELDAHIFLPKGVKETEKRPAMVYFHGGSWREGKPNWHFGESEFGFVSISVEYRTYGRYGVLPFQQVSDVKSFFRWLRTHAKELKVDPDKIIASGISAGGHLILCSAMIDSLNDTEDNLAINPKPNLIVLNSAVYDLSDWNWFDYLLKEKSESLLISPVHIVKKGLPPMLIFHGRKDASVPFETALNFVGKLKASGNYVDFYPIDHAGHELWLNPEFLKISGGIKKGFFQKFKYL